MCDGWTTETLPETMTIRSSVLKISLTLNAVLLLALLALGFLYIRDGFVSGQALDARPRGAVITLQEDTRIVSTDAPAIVLPKGTVLQESTPQGAATLGKIYDRQYLLMIKTEDASFSKNRPTEKASTWADPYVFAAKRTLPETKR
jgi:hypothetical protein